MCLFFVTCKQQIYTYETFENIIFENNRLEYPNLALEASHSDNFKFVYFSCHVNSIFIQLLFNSIGAKDTYTYIYMHMGL